MRGELLLRARERDESQAAHCFEQALALGRSGGARLWELRAALSLARLYAQQKRPGDASSVLAPVCEWFADAPDSVDLVEARALLDELQHGIVNANRDPFQ